MDESSSSSPSSSNIQYCFSLFNFIHHGRYVVMSHCHLMTNEVEPLSICLFDIWIFSFVFCYWVICFLFWFVEVLYIPWTWDLFQIHVLQISSLASLFPLIDVFDKWWFNLSMLKMLYFRGRGVWLIFMFKNLCFLQCYEDILLFSSWHCVVLSLALRSTIHLAFIPVCSMRVWGVS